jgi:hypothetical protein
MDDDDICFKCGQPCFRTGFENACEYDPNEDDEIEGVDSPEEYGLEET